MPKKSKAPVQEKKPTEGVKWSFAAGTNLLPNFGAKIERESKLRLNDFSKELRSFSIVDMSGTNKITPYKDAMSEAKFHTFSYTLLVKHHYSNHVSFAGRNFGDEGLFFLAESLAYNQV